MIIKDFIPPAFILINMPFSLDSDTEKILQSAQQEVLALSSIDDYDTVKSLATETRVLLLKWDRTPENLNEICAQMKESALFHALPKNVQELIAIWRAYLKDYLIENFVTNGHAYVNAPPTLILNQVSSHDSHPSHTTLAGTIGPIETHLLASNEENEAIGGITTENINELLKEALYCQKACFYEKALKICLYILDQQPYHSLAQMGYIRAMEALYRMEIIKARHMEKESNWQMAIFHYKNIQEKFNPKCKIAKRGLQRCQRYLIK